MIYDVIYADPPWPRRKGGHRKVRPAQGRSLDYKTLPLTTIEDHIGAWVNVGHPQVLFLWTIDKFLHEAETIASRLGFRLHARLIWNKLNGVAPAFTVRFAHEYLLWLYSERFTPIAKQRRGKFLTVFDERATQHSKKPQKGYELIEALYPDASKIELYARYSRAGWVAWGNEVNWSNE